MTLQEQILRETELFSGYLSQEDAECAENLIYAVVPYLRARLRSDVVEEEILPTFISAAALLTLSMLEAAKLDGLQTLSAGTMQLNFNAQNDRRVRLAFVMLAPFSKEGIAFRGVAT